MSAATQATPAATLQDAVAALARLGCKPTKSGDGYKALCPVHEADGGSHTPSLTIKAGDTQPFVVTCHASCKGTDILKALDLAPAPRHNGKRRIVAEYSYRDADGREVREKIRYEPKDFRIRHRDAAGKWVYKAGDGPVVLYLLPELKAAIAEGRTVFVAEGEKDADRLASLGLVATCNIEGAAKPEQRAKWRSEYTEQLSGAARVILLPDNDEPGRAHMRHIAKQLQGKVDEVRWLELPGLPEKGDVSDWLDAGCTVEELERLANEATHEQPEPVAATAVPPRANKGDKLPPQNVMAHMLATEVFQSRLRMDPVTSRWLEYQPDAGTFKPRPAGSVERAVYLAISDLYGAFPASYVSGVTKLLAYEATTEIEPAHGKIPFQNGVLDLNTRELLPHSPDFGFTAAMPYPWDPHAPAPQVVIDWLLEAVGGHADQVQLLRAFLQAVVVGRPDLQRYLELVGPGGSGKGTFMRLADALVGICSVHSTQLSQLENNRFETAALFGKRLVLVTDAEKWRGDVSVLKSITGQDPIRYEQKHVQAGESFTFNGMVILAGNQHLESTDYSSGIQRRRITVDFSHVVQPGQRRDLEAEFAPHLAGVMKWVLDMPEHEVTAYLRSTSVHVGSLKQTRIDTLAMTNPIAGWLMDAVEFGPGFMAQVGTRKEIRITSGDGVGKAESWTEYDRQGEWLYPNYCRWCDERGKRPIACNAFAAQLLDVAKNMLGQDVAKMPRSAGGVRVSGLRVKRAYEGFEPEPNSAAPVSDSVEPVSNYVEPVSYQPIESVELFELCPNYKDKHSDATANTEEKTQDHASHGVDVENRANVGGKSDKSAEVRQVQHYQGLDTTLIQHTSTLVRHQCSTTAPATPTATESHARVAHITVPDRPPVEPRVVTVQVLERPKPEPRIVTVKVLESPVCQPSANYPFRLVVRCDRPTPIPNPAGFGDPIGCANCGAVFGSAQDRARSEAGQQAKAGVAS